MHFVSCISFCRVRQEILSHRPHRQHSAGKKRRTPAVQEPMGTHAPVALHTAVYPVPEYPAAQPTPALQFAPTLVPVQLQFAAMPARSAGWLLQVTEQVGVRGRKAIVVRHRKPLMPFR
jgi:hypothetical protein